MKLVFATNNLHKLNEIRHILKNAPIDILSLDDIGCYEEIPETSNTLEGNARQKAQFIYKKYDLNCFADDTGLEVEALNGRPGVYSARYAGEGCSFDDNIDKLLEEMRGINNRRATFRTVIALMFDGKEHFFTGEVSGTILNERSGTNGFGYDPVFMPEAYNNSFAEMDAVTKNGISHRYHATHKLYHFLLKLTESQ